MPWNDVEGQQPIYTLAVRYADQDCEVMASPSSRATRVLGLTDYLGYQVDLYMPDEGRNNGVQLQHFVDPGKNSRNVKRNVEQAVSDWLASL